jgi:hypothetical protein
LGTAENEELKSKSSQALYQSDARSLEILVLLRLSTVKFTSLEIESGTAANQRESDVERRYINPMLAHSKSWCY